MVVNPYPPGGSPWFSPTGGSTPPQMYTTNGAPNYTTQGSSSQQDYDWDAVMMALAQQNQFNQGIQQGGLDNQGRQIDNTHQYQQGLLAQARAQLAQQAQQFEQTHGLAVGSLTGMFNGQPTLAALGQQGQMTGYYQGAPTLQNLAQQAQYTGMYGQTPTLQAIGQQQQFGLQQGALTGTYGGGLTLPAWQAQQQAAQNQGAMLGHYNGSPTLQAQLGLGQLGLQQAGVTGTYNGQQTLAAQQQAAQLAALQQQLGFQQAGVTGQYNGAPTLAAQQLAQQGQQARGALGLNTLQLGASLGGPSDWLNYSEAASGARQNPLLAQGVASWADMTNGGPRGSGGWGGGDLQPRTLGTLAGDFGGGQPPGGGALVGGAIDQTGTPIAPGQQQQPTQAGLSPQEQERFAQLAARAVQVRAAGEPLSPVDLDEMQRFLARGATLPSSAFAMGTPGAAPQAGSGAMAGGYMVQAPDGSWSQGGGQMAVSPQQPMVREGPPGGGMSPMGRGGSWAMGATGQREPVNMWGPLGGNSAAPAPVYGSQQNPAGQLGMPTGTPQWGLNPVADQQRLAASGRMGTTSSLQGASSASPSGPNARTTADYMADVGRKTSEWAPGFWGSLNSDQQDMYKGAWTKSGQSPATVLANRSRNSISQGFGRA